CWDWRRTVITINRFDIVNDYPTIVTIMNRLTIKLFATLRERARAAELSREFPEGTTVGEIWGRLLGEFPALGGHHDGVAFAVNQEYVNEDFRPRNEDEVAFIPPVSGGVDTASSNVPW